MFNVDFKRSRLYTIYTTMETNLAPRIFPNKEAAFSTKAFNEIKNALIYMKNHDGMYEEEYCTFLYTARALEVSMLAAQKTDDELMEIAQSFWEILLWLQKQPEKYFQHISPFLPDSIVHYIIRHANDTTSEWTSFVMHSSHNNTEHPIDEQELIQSWQEFQGLYKTFQTKTHVNPPITKLWQSYTFYIIFLIPVLSFLDKVLNLKEKMSTKFISSLWIVIAIINALNLLYAILIMPSNSLKEVANSKTQWFLYQLGTRCQKMHNAPVWRAYVDHPQLIPTTDEGLCQKLFLTMMSYDLEQCRAPLQEYLQTHPDREKLDPSTFIKNLNNYTIYLTSGEKSVFVAAYSEHITQEDLINLTREVLNNIRTPIQQPAQEQKGILSMLWSYPSEAESRNPTANANLAQKK